MEYKFTIQIQMEFRQVNGTIERQIFLDDCEKAPQIFQLQHLMECQIKSILLRGVAPFVVREQNNLRRESIVSECQDIQKRILTYNRKEKSLAELSKKFLNKFEGAHSTLLALDEVTKDLKVQRRRIYDIINIMESLGVVCKEKKNIYQWKGLSKAIQTINFYRAGNFPQKKDKLKKQKSLQTLSGEFLRLFLTHRSILTLDEATSIILNDADEKMRKTKIRRLYDIVNVFKCLGLVKKVHIETGKNGFQWMGVDTLREIIEKKNNKSCWSKLEEESSEEDYEMNDSNSANDNKENQPDNFQRDNSLLSSKKSMVTTTLQRRDTTILTEPEIVRKEEEQPGTEDKRMEETPRMSPICEPLPYPQSYFEILMKKLGQSEQSIAGIHKSFSGMIFPNMGVSQ